MNELSGKAKLAVVLGSGLGTLEQLVKLEVAYSYRDVPGLSSPSVEGHPGRMSLARVGGSPLLLFSGRLHVYEGLDFWAVGKLVSTAVELGCQRILLTHTAGSLHRSLPVGEWMLPTDIVYFPMDACWRISSAESPVRRDVTASVAAPSSLISGSFRGEVERAAIGAGVPLQNGNLFWTTGPAYETPAEARAAAGLGADAVTMSSLPELVIARDLGIESAVLSLITNFAPNVSSERVHHDHVVKRGEACATRLKEILEILLNPTPLCEGKYAGL